MPDGTSKRIDGRAISDEITKGISKQVQILKEAKITPGLAAILVGENPASKIYVKNKRKACQDTGIYFEEYNLPLDTTQGRLYSLIDKLNSKNDINGIIVQLPLPKHLDEKRITSRVACDKDVDGFCPKNAGLMLQGSYRLLPCTPAGIMELLRHENIKTEGKFSTVIGRSNIVGKPMAILLLHADSTVTICHRKTKNLKEICLKSDIIVCAAGKAGLITGDMVKKGAIVIDVGMNRDSNGKIVGDVLFDEVSKKASHITPVPGGVGPMTVAMLLKNVITATFLQNPHVPLKFNRY
ncbi:MAG: bifunctional methylenetetrahydrofolate dehydrogenase/methenyltetrahydrofolate cyclohydrolase FolD [Oscillospiraceae bacterium]|jgi:methylenetetrahydrofolate dehydrogenase (NADP+)/methenyltetrahydrofolate cyclohydrolase|nr:bifunctional methylenetetrahydrofolate dehydrogenase/methenyltetrahydrofolate cyclohydrolase FolD [Oscillospiraceae bacterium]